MDDILSKRADVLEKYSVLREQHPALPEVLREFQVCSMMSVIDGGSPMHMFQCRPT